MKQITRTTNKFFLTIISLCLLSFTLAGCNSESSKAPQLKTPTVTFELTGTEQLLVGSTFDNPATSDSGSAVKYRSSNDAVATVSAQGRVTAISPGDAKIIAEVAANAEFTAASADYPVSVVTLAFDKTGTAKLIVGENFTNPAGPLNGRTAIYSSSNDSVASVNDQGVVTALSDGSSTIGVNVAAAAGLTAESDSYLVDVIANTAQLGGWVGADGAELALSEGLLGIELYGSSDPDCDFDNPPPCNNERSFVLVPVDEPINDPDLTLSQAGHYQLRHGDHRLDISLDADATQPGFAGREEHQVVLFKAENDDQERLWLVGGGNDDQEFNDVWSSEDGLHWTKQEAVNTETGEALFAPRHGHQLVVFNNKLWLIGGNKDGNVRLNDIWSSADGIHWTEEVPNGSAGLFPAREGHQVVVFDADGNGDKLWLLGGKGNDFSDPNFGVFNDVWSSPNGTDWTEHPIEGGQRFSRRFGHQVVVFNVDENQGKRLWMTAGMHFERQTLVINVEHKDVWSSSNGVNWQQETLNGTSFAKRSHHRVVVADDKLWLLGGELGQFPEYNDLWSSSDGVTWSLRDADSASFPKLGGHQLITLAPTAGTEQLMLIGGYMGGDTDASATNDIWLAPIPADGETPLWRKRVISDDLTFPDDN